MRSFGAAVTVLRGAVCALARVPRLTAHAYTNPVLAIVAVKGSVSSACSAVAVPNIFVPSLAIGWGRGFRETRHHTVRNAVTRLTAEHFSSKF